VLVDHQGESSIITIADNGSGFPESLSGQAVSSICESRKENGTGLGLTVVQKIVQDHGGEVSVETHTRR